ncbi:50S ribosomal protein L32 [bacterium]|nr:50S ribosomal protein L32 [bacterium]MBU1651114.1 50S ribosomal protein L32 [bacterium]
MAVPKRRTSKARRDKRRTHFKAQAPSLSTCPSCGEIKQPHHVCPNCGFYRDRKVIVPEEA